MAPSNQSCCDDQDSTLKTKIKGLMPWSWYWTSPRPRKTDQDCIKAR